MWPTPDAGPGLQPAAAADFEALLALRVRAMQPSLQALGRFDPERARGRFAATFLPEHMWHIVVQGQRAGCVSLRPKPGALRMDHLYIEPAAQRRGIGSWAMDWACSTADLRQQALELAALQGSDANRFYQRRGLVEVSRSDYDIEYRRAPAADPMQVVRELWARFQARDWVGARQLVRDDVCVDWWASGEIIRGGGAFIAVQAEYPEGWTIHLLQLMALADGRVLSMARVEHPPGNFLVHSIVRVRDGRIAHGEELWATCEAPPAWRTPERFPGLAHMPGWPGA
jgi:GNAT superfamily N-acetyltransferase/ketosteroid isomerase-like protein